MQRPVVLLLALLALPTSLLKAQENSKQATSKTNSSPQSSNSVVVNLLQESHDLNPQFNLSTRVYLLERQADAMSRVDAALGEAWAHELLALATQTKGNLRSGAENSAMTTLVRLNPDRALLLLHTLSKEEPLTDFTLSLPNTQLAERVFHVLAERDGVSALPVLEQEAARMGTDGCYPYAPLAHATMDSISKELAPNRRHAVEVVQAVFDRALEKYNEAPHGYGDDFEFGQMLQVFAGVLPHESLQPALRLLVKNLQATDTSKYNFQGEAFTDDGKTVMANNAIDAGILFFSSLINGMDPELAQQLGATRPELQTAMEYAKDGRLRGGGFNGNGQSRNHPPPRDPSAEIGTEAMRMASFDLDTAIAKAKEVPDDAIRADTILSIAREIAGSQPERAQELIAEVEGNNKSDIPELQLDVISAKAFIAAAQDKKDEVRELLQQGFTLANPIITELQKSGGASFVPGLGQLVQIGMQNDPDSTLTFVRSLPASWLKANLLLGAASALTMRTRLPIGSKDLQKLEKSN